MTNRYLSYCTNENSKSCANCQLTKGYFMWYNFYMGDDKPEFDKQFEKEIPQ